MPAGQTAGGRTMTDTALDELGPIDYVVVEFPGNKMTGEGLPILVDLVERGIIRVLDLVFFTKADDGSVAMVEIADFDGDGELDLAIFEGASSGLVGEEDVNEAAAAVEGGSSAALLVYENRRSTRGIRADPHSGARGRSRSDGLVLKP
jgi:hypothetical protein